MSQEEKKKLYTLLVLVGVFLVILFFAVILPNIHSKSEEAPEVAKMQGNKSGLPPGAPPTMQMPGKAGGPPAGMPGAGGGGPAGMGKAAPPQGPGGPTGGAPSSPMGSPPGAGAGPAGFGGAGPPGAAGGQTPTTPGSQPSGETKVAAATPLLPHRSDPFSPEGSKGGARFAGIRKARGLFNFERLALLPPVRIQEASPSQRRPPAPPLGARRELAESPGMRLSGILLNRSVYAILEKMGVEESASGRKGYVVKPGDQLDGLQVVKIERYREGKETRTTMVVRDTDGQTKLVRLKEGPPPPQQQQGGGPGGGAGGMPGRMPGGMPGAGPAGGMPGMPGMPGVGPAGGAGGPRPGGVPGGGGRRRRR